MRKRLVERPRLLLHLVLGALAASLLPMVAGAQTQGPLKISLDDAIQMALVHNHALLAARTTIQQSEAEEVTANLRPNPVLFADWDYLPLFTGSAMNATYLNDSTEADLGLSYLFERGGKRQRRLQAARDVTAQTKSLVADNERTLTFNVASQFIAAELAESALDLANEDLKSFQNTVDITQERYRTGEIGEDDYLKIKLQLLQFQTDASQAQLAKVQALSDLRQSLGYESVSASYDIAGAFDYQPVHVNLDDLQMKALQNRPDFRAAQQGVAAANSAYRLQKAIRAQDVTVNANYSHVNSINGASFYASIPLAIFNRNQGEIARAQYAIAQAEEQQKASSDQVLTEVRDAYESVRANDQIIDLYRSGYLDQAKQSRDISEYAYQRGAASLLDYLDAERSYRAIQLSYRQALASYLTDLEQLREAVGTRNLP